MLLTLALTARATTVLVVHTAQDYNDDVVDKLLATGSFDAVDAFEALSATPTLDELAGYDAVLVYSDYSFADAVGLGNVLADYVDVGGGVVEAVFSHGTVALEGRFVDEAYEPISGSGQGQGRSLTMVEVEPGHALLDGVASFDGGTGSFHTDDAVLTEGAVEVARWSNGMPLVAVKGSQVGLNFFPPSSDARVDLWTATTDGTTLLRNALVYAADATPPDADGDGVPDDWDTCPGADDSADADEDGVADACDACPFDAEDACADDSGGPGDTGCEHEDDDDDHEDDDDGEHEDDDDQDHRGGAVTVRWCCDTGRAGDLAWLAPLALLAFRRRR